MSIAATGGQSTALIELARQPGAGGFIAHAVGWTPICGQVSDAFDPSITKAFPLGFFYSGDFFHCKADILRDSVFPQVKDPAKVCSAIAAAPVNMYGEYYLPLGDDPGLLTCHLGIGTHPGISRGPLSRAGPFALAKCFRGFANTAHALDNGQRSPKKLLAAVVRRVLYALRWSR